MMFAGRRTSPAGSANVDLPGRRVYPTYPIVTDAREPDRPVGRCVDSRRRLYVIGVRSEHLDVSAHSQHTTAVSSANHPL